MSYGVDIEQPKGRIAPWLAEPLRENRKLYIKVGLAAAMINFFGLVIALFTMTVYDRVVPNSAIESLIGLSIGLAIVLIMDFFLKMLRAYFVDVAGARVDRQIGKTIFDRILGMRLDLGRRSTGGLAALVREIETLRDFFASASLTTLVDVPFIIITLAVIAMIGGWLVLVPMVLVPLVILAGLMTQPVMRKLSARTLDEGLGKQAVLVETISSLETVKSANAGGMLKDRWDDSMIRHSRSSLSQRLTSNFSINIAGSAQTMAYTGIVIFGVFKIADQSLTLGGLIACSILAGRAVSPLGSIAQLLTKINAARTAYQQIDKIMSQPAEGPESGGGLVPQRFDGEIEFRDVDFRYPGAPELALTGVSFKIKKGEHVALIGPIGSGKSTIARLLIGLYPPSSGLVMIDGTDIRQISPPALRANVGSLLQENTLLTGSIRENILLRREDLDDSEMIRASKAALAHEFISRLPNGYDLQLADRGEGLSGGQKQAIAMARALVGSPPILVFDEPTSAMDTNTEAQLITHLREEFEGRTLVVITHRPSLLGLVDRVIMMSRGRLAMDGTPEEITRKVTRLAGR